MKALKTAAFVVGVVVVLACLVLGTEKVSSHFRAARHRAQAGVDEISPDVHEAARIRVLLADFDDEILANQDVLADLAGEVQNAERVIADLEQQRGKEVETMRRADALLQQGKESYEIGGRTYSRAEVSADARYRLERCKQLDEEIAAQRAIRGQALLRLKEGEALVLKARTERQKAEGELNGLLVRIRNARMMERLNEMTSRLQSTGVRSELGKTLAAFRKRAEKLERRNAYYQTAARQGAVVDWEAGGATDEEVRRAISDYLNAHPENRPLRPEARDDARVPRIDALSTGAAQ